MTLITLLTDFGLKDGYPGVMKGVIWGIAPQAQIADITHLIQPQNVLEGALVLSRAAPYFPPGTIHLAVVDPGVGTSRRPIAAMLGNQFFVGPDNGLCSQLLAHSQLVGASTHFVHLNRPEFWLSQPSSTFHGRDIFAPAAAHLANGVDLSELGTPIGDPVVISPPQPVRSKRRLARRGDPGGQLWKSLHKPDSPASEGFLQPARKDIRKADSGVSTILRQRSTR